MTPKKIVLTVNGIRHECDVAPNRTLVKFLRYDLGLTGTNVGCEEGECGACTVLVDGVPLTSCLVLAVEVDGCSIETIEGQAKNGQLSDVQEAFVATGAIQCGFCSPGMIMSTTALLTRNPRPHDEEIRDALAGNLCRCTGYKKIIDAVKMAADKRSGS